MEGDTTTKVSKSHKKTDFKTKTVKENDVEVIVDVGSNSPKHSDCHYDPSCKVSRSLVATSLAAYCETDFSVFQPVKCLDAMASTGISGLTWAKHLPGKIEVNINAPTTTAATRVRENCKRNGLEATVTTRDPRIMLDEGGAFNFIHLECFATAAQYLDSALRRLPRGGVLAVSTVDDPALYCKTPDVALRSYGGLLGKTTYYKEMGARLILASVARIAASHNKAIRTLWTYSYKGQLTIVVQVDKGPVKANECLKQVRRLLHCNICEERAFLPDTGGFLIAEPYRLLRCQCRGQHAGKTALDLGPLWSAELFDPHFLRCMLEIRTQFPWAADVKGVLDRFLEESLCPSIGTPPDPPDTSEEGDPPATKKARLLKVFSAKSTAPPFYLNLHKNGTKDAKLLRVERVVICLRNAGFRASRTHFDLEAVRTDASLREFHQVLATGSVRELEDRHSADF